MYLTDVPTEPIYTVHIIILTLPKYRLLYVLITLVAYIPAEPNTNTGGAYRSVPTDVHMILLAYNSTTSTTECTPMYR